MNSHLVGLPLPKGYNQKANYVRGVFLLFDSCLQFYTLDTFLLYPLYSFSFIIITVLTNVKQKY